MKRLRCILKSKYLFKLLALISLIGAILFTRYYRFESCYEKDDDTFVGIVTDYKVNNGKISIKLKAKEVLIVNYSYDNLVFDTLNYGDKLIVKGKLYTPNDNSIFNSFSYKDYLYNKKIFYIVRASSINKIENNSNYFYTLKNILYDRVNGFESGNYIKTLLFGDNNLSNEVKDSYRINGISHLFSISGMHINLIIGILYIYLDRITYNKHIKYLICDVFLIFYLIFAYTSSLLRASIMFIFSSINYIFKFEINKIDIMLFTLVMAIFINPFIIYDIGFIYSYLISFFLILFYDKYKNKNYFVKGIYTSIIAFLVSFPITVFYFYEVNVFNIVINILIVPIVSIILIPLAIITLFFPICDNILFFFTNLLEDISFFLNNISFMRVIFYKPSIVIVILYFVIIYGIYRYKKFIYLFFIVILIHFFYPYFNNNLEITMFDVGEGDSYLVSFPNNLGNILIDTGEDDGYSIMKNDIIMYLKSKGIRKLDYVIISHGDKDHIGGLVNLINNFKVDMVIFNRGDKSLLEEEDIGILNSMNIKYDTFGDKIDIHGISLYFLNDKIFDNENDNSNVIYFEYLKYKFLFMGDASSNVEDYIMSKYNISDISFLKVGHHGSKTSSSKDFIDYVTPKISLISLGRGNIYGHPNKEVLENLNDSKIYRTDLDGSINIKINKNKVRIYTAMKREGE